MELTRNLLAASWRSWSSPDLHRVGPPWLQLVWTLLFCMFIAFVFTVIGFARYGSGENAWRNWSAWADWYGLNLVVSCCIGYTIHGLHELLPLLIGRDRIRAFPMWKRVVYFGGVPMLGLAIGWPLGGWLVQGDGPGWFRGDNANAIAGSVLLGLVITLVLYPYFSLRARQIDAERRATEAQLKLLQAQIEPHFLFNTLANVQALLDHDVPTARAMLESFTDYLRASLGALRHDQRTLGSEVELLQSYLKLLQTRMHDRLSYRFDIDPDAEALPLPALLLQPLVENAIHHGLEPKVEGGTVIVSARREGRMVVIETTDNGIGIAAATARRRRGAGMALANLRERLATLYGDSATLTLNDAHPGTRATLCIPMESMR